MSTNHPTKSKLLLSLHLLYLIATLWDRSLMISIIKSINFLTLFNKKHTIPSRKPNCFTSLTNSIPHPSILTSMELTISWSLSKPKKTYLAHFQHQKSNPSIENHKTQLPLCFHFTFLNKFHVLTSQGRSKMANP